MKRTLILISVVAAVLTILAIPVLAQEPAAQQAAQKPVQVQMWQIIASCFGMALAAAGCGYAQSKALTAGCEGVARNPGATDTIRFFILLGLAFIEFLALLTFLVVLIFFLQG